MPTKKKTEFPEEITTPLEAQDPQTEEDTAALPAEGVPDDACDASLSQTETDSAEADASSAGIPDGALNEPTESQTEVKKPRRRKKAETESAQSDTEPENAPNAKEDGVDTASKPKRKRTIPNRACRCCPLTIVQRSKRRRIRPRMTCSTSSSRSEAAVS